MIRNIRKKTPISGAFIFMAVICLLSPLTPAFAGDDPEGIMEVNLSLKPDPLNKDVEKGLDHVYNILHTPGSQIDVTKLQAMMDFVMDTEDPKDIEPAKRFGGIGICLRRQVEAPLDRVLRFFYNPEIPNFLLCPAVLAQSGWQPGCEFVNRKTGLWEELDNLDAPVMVRGVEYEMTAPDSFAESYYRYDLDRLMILFKYRGKNVLMSVTEQLDKSDVGKKGAILDDKEWDYFYSGIPGLNRGMIGWMDTFTYASGSVQIYIDEGGAQPKTTVFLFKWLKAGWAGLNVVKRSHIYDGALRYSRSFAKVMESDDLTPEMLAEAMGQVKALDSAQVKALMKQYAVNFETKFKADPKLEDDDYAEIIENGEYFKVLDEEASRALLALQKLKSMLGMEALVAVGTPVDMNKEAAEAPALEAPAPEAQADETPATITGAVTPGGTEAVVPES